MMTATVSEDGVITLSSGKVIGDFNGVVGIAFDDGEWIIGEGYDTTLYITENPLPTGCDITKADAIELADRMIERWKAFRASLS